MAERILWWIILAACLVGHYGIHIAIYNRLNAFGIQRRLLKSIVLVFALTAVLIPPAMFWIFGDVLKDLLHGRPDNLTIPGVMKFYGTACLLSWVVLGLPWLAWRPILGREWVTTTRESEIVNVGKRMDNSLAITTKCRVAQHLPLNQIFELSIDQIQLPVVGLPEKLDGYRLAQFSDVHLTGHVHGDFTKYVVQRASQWNPNLMALSGDIIDRHHCIDWIEDIFSGANATDGCYFVLGNHDTRIADPELTRRAMSRAGWTDVGQQPTQRELAGVDSQIIGNERPWFPAPDVALKSPPFRLLLSHSPDQFPWARKHNVHLMLAGHTHGGQGRLPLAGPILSPSFHGSRWASGDFFKPPTTLHVSRGLSGTHLMRINCRPQLSLLTLRKA